MEIDMEEIDEKIGRLEIKLINLRRLRDEIKGNEYEIGRLFRTAEALGFKEDLICSRNRTQRVVFVRCVMAERLLESKLTSGQIGKILRRDHATVLYWHRMYENAAREPRFYRDLVAFINDFDYQYRRTL